MAKCRLELTRIKSSIKDYDLISTSPPFALLRQKGYGNVASEECVEWFRPFAEQFKRILKPDGSLILLSEIDEDPLGGRNNFSR